MNNTEDVLVVPLEVEVTSSAGIFDPQGSIDFGVGGSLDFPKKVKLYLQNPLKKPVRIHSVTSTSEAIKIEYENIKIPAESRGKNGQLNSFEVATLTLDCKFVHNFFDPKITNFVTLGDVAFKTKDFSGRIVVKYKNGKGITEIPYYITVLEGGLTYNATATRYFINGSPESMQSRKFKVKNDFLTPVMLINVSLAAEASDFFEVSWKHTHFI